MMHHTKRIVNSWMFEAGIGKVPTGWLVLACGKIETVGDLSDKRVNGNGDDRYG